MRPRIFYFKVMKNFNYKDVILLGIIAITFVIACTCNHHKKTVSFNDGNGTTGTLTQAQIDSLRNDSIRFKKAHVIQDDSNSNAEKIPTPNN